MTDNPFELGGSVNDRRSSGADINAYISHVNQLMRDGDVAAFERWQLLKGVDYSQLKVVVGDMNQIIKARKEKDEPVELPVDGRPQFSVVSFDPLEFDIYGRSRKKAPHLTGSLVLSRLLTAPSPEGASVYCALEQNNETFGFKIGSMAQLDRIAQALDRPPVSALLAPVS
ncbi:MAG TPA: hypothetical protein VIJ68_04220 [Candidatus Saccharimonadales bacterium]